MLLLACIAASSCSAVKGAFVVDRPAARVALKGYQLDLEYGKDPPADSAFGMPDPDSSFLLPGLPTGQTVRPDLFTEPGLEELLTSTLAAHPTFKAPPGPCPEPGPDVAAERPISTDVKGPPEAGVYRYKLGGTITLGPLSAKLSGLTNRFVRNVRPNPLGGTDYESDFVQGSLIRQKQALRVVPAAAAGAAQPLAAGLQLVALDLTTPSGRLSFQPLAPVSIFPLPATENATFSGVGFDPATNTSLAVQGRIARKDRVDGCGEVVDGWTAETTWTFVRPPQSPVAWQYSYTVAPQHGGLVVADHLVTADTVGGIPLAIDTTSAVGGIHPTPEKA